jgi:Outer membrane protein beta-barrel domain
MKKCILALVAILLAASPAFSASSSSRQGIYLGVDNGLSFVTSSGKYDNRLLVYSAHIGYVWNERLRFELGHVASALTKNGTSEFSYSSQYLDAMGSWKYGKDYDILGVFGITRVAADFTNPVGKSDGYGVRLGTGFRVYANQSWEIRTLWRYNIVDIQRIGGVSELTIGIDYRF